MTTLGSGLRSTPVDAAFDPVTDELVQKSREMYRMVRDHDVAFVDNFDLALEYHLPKASVGTSTGRGPCSR